MTMINVSLAIDGKLLAKQKETLIELASNQILNETQEEHLCGVLNVLDVFTDAIAEKEQERLAKDFKSLAPLFGLEADDLGRIFIHEGVAFSITGLAPDCPECPVMVVGVLDGINYKFPISIVDFALAE